MWLGLFGLVTEIAGRELEFHYINAQLGAAVLLLRLVTTASTIALLLCLYRVHQAEHAIDCIARGPLRHGTRWLSNARGIL
jgi:hypothetical protein